MRYAKYISFNIRSSQSKIKGNDASIIPGPIMEIYNFVCYFFSSFTWFHGFCLLLVSIPAWGGRPIKLSLKTYAALSLLFICSPQRHTDKYSHGRKRNQNQQELKLDTSLFSGKLNPFFYLYSKKNIIYSSIQLRSPSHGMELACKVRNRKVGLTVDASHSGVPKRGDVRAGVV